MSVELVIVGRDWGFQEQQQGKPFVGPSGKLLDKALAQAGLERTSPKVLVTNVVNARPPADEWGAHSRAAVEEGLDKLQQLLTVAKPRLIVALGEQALGAVTARDPWRKPRAKETITETRGYVFESPFGDCLAMVHPAFILRTWHPWWATFCWDWQHAARLLTSEHRRVAQLARAPGCGPGEPGSNPGRLMGVSECVLPDTASGAEWLHIARVADAVAVDIETVGAGDNCRPVCIGFAASAREAVVVPWTPEWLPFIQEALALPVPKIFHNGQFDVTILERAGTPVVRWEHDTMLLFHALDPLIAGKQTERKGTRTEKSLRFLASLLLDEPFWKSYAFSSRNDQLLLCAKDARVTFAIWDKLISRITNTSSAIVANDGNPGATSTNTSALPTGGSTPANPARNSRPQLAMLPNPNDISGA